MNFKTEQDKNDVLDIFKNFAPKKIQEPTFTEDDLKRAEGMFGDSSDNIFGDLMNMFSGKGK